MNYDEIDVEKEVQAIDEAMECGDFRPATKKETMEIRLAALAAIVNQMQDEMHDIVQNEKELTHV